MKYDPFQNLAIQHINDGYSVIVSAPTGAGKTVIAEHVIQTCLDQGQKVVYTAPIKALSNQKYREFREQSPDSVGILTGDVTINQDAPTLIMTTEIFRNKILEEHSSLNEYGWVIFDEIHYLDDHDRGSVWEESLIFLPEHMNILGLSATIPNLHQFAAWLRDILHRQVKIVVEDKRPVPLHFYFQCQGEIYDDVKALRKYGYKSKEFRSFPNTTIPRSIPLPPQPSRRFDQPYPRTKLVTVHLLYLQPPANRVPGR
jgi:superfamily II RNA helicase